VAFFGCSGAHVVENLAAWAARAGVAHGPEIVFKAGNFKDAIGRNVLREPEIFRFVIGTKFVAGETSAPPKL